MLVIIYFANTPQGHFLFDKSNKVAPQGHFLFDKSNKVAPQGHFLFDKSNKVAHKLIKHFGMLIGEYKHTIDTKKRLSLPSKFRKELGKKVVLTRGLDNCIFVYSISDWKNIADKLGTLSIGQSDSRGFNRFMLSGAIEVDVDTAGRVLVPDFLKDFAKLKNKVVLTGVYNRVEIWNEKLWNEYKNRIEKEADVLAEKLGDIGML